MGVSIPRQSSQNVATGTVYRYLYPSVSLVGTVPVPTLYFLALLGGTVRYRYVRYGSVGNCRYGTGTVGTGTGTYC